MYQRITLVTLALAAWVAGLAVAQKAAPEHPMMQPSKGFTLLQPLVGEWDGQSADGKTVHSAYRVVSNGTALMEELHMGGEPEMVTVYSADGEKVAMTHFCSAGNQPQMETGPITGDTKSLSFDFLRATNLANATDGHMHHLTVTLVDKDHYTEEWTWQEKGAGHTALFHFTRKA